MKKITAILFAAVLFTGVAFSQTPEMRIGGALNIALPVGTFGDIAGTGVGVTGQFELKFLPNLTGTGTIGYIKWAGKDFGGYSYSISGVPILVGAKYYLVPMVPFYALANLGLTIISTSTDVPSVNVFGYSFGGGSVSASSSEFTFAIGAGYEIPLPSFIIDVNAAFNIISNSNYLGVKAGVLLPL